MAQSSEYVIRWHPPARQGSLAGWIWVCPECGDRQSTSLSEAMCRAIAADHEAWHEQGGRR